MASPMPAQRRAAGAGSGSDDSDSGRSADRGRRAGASPTVVAVSDCLNPAAAQPAAAQRLWEPHNTYFKNYQPHVAVRKASQASDRRRSRPNSTSHNVSDSDSSDGDCGAKRGDPADSDTDSSTEPQVCADFRPCFAFIVAQGAYLSGLVCLLKYKRSPVYIRAYHVVFTRRICSRTWTSI